MDPIPCEACGCTEYTQRSGFFICNNCDTQSQNIEVQHFDSDDFQRGADDGEREEIRSERSFADRKLTSWECYNILLAGLVEELIDLGASRQIRVLAFQLWAAYLQTSNVAFTSKTEEKIPALSLGFKNSDAQILYGIPMLKPKLFNISRGYPKRLRKRRTNDSASETLSVASSRSIKMKQRRKALSETMNQSDYEKPDVETLESLEKERESQKILKRNIIFKSSARTLLKEIVGPKCAPTQDLVTLKEQKKKRRSKVHKWVYYRKRKISSQIAPNASLTSITLIAILRVALQLANDEIFLADILRWICEGRLSVNQPEKFVPSFSLLVKKYDLLNAQRGGFQTEINNLANNLNLPDIPTPNLFKLAERYCTELCLPNDFLKLVLKLMVDSKVKMDYSNYKFRIFPDYECRVMALILFVFKLLFGLNDFTEFQQSAFADAVNESQRSETEEIPKLFSWNSWKKFMECRKAVLSRYDAPISELARYERYCEENVFFDRWEKVKSTFETTERKINDALISSLRQEITSLSSENMQHSDRMNSVASPASVTPLSTLTEYILINHSSSLPSRTKKILSESFKTHSIKYALDSNWCSDVAESSKMKVELCSLDDQLDLEIYRSNDDPFRPITLSANTALNRSVPVFIHSKEPSSKRRTEDELVPFEGSIYKEDTKSAGRRQKNDAEIYKASPYWCIHSCSSLHIHAFEDVARRKFPRSFLWLLCECASMLRSNTKELYLELILVENVLHRLYGTPIIKKDVGYNCKIKMNEW